MPPARAPQQWQPVLIVQLFHPGRSQMQGADRCQGAGRQQQLHPGPSKTKARERLQRLLLQAVEALPKPELHPLSSVLLALEVAVADPSSSKNCFATCACNLQRSQTSSLVISQLMRLPPIPIIVSQSIYRLWTNCTYYVYLRSAHVHMLLYIISM